MIDHAQPTYNDDPAPRKPAFNCSSQRQVDLLGDLARPMNAPDMTRSIMGRLGYMKVPPVVSRRHRLRRAAGRLGMLCASLFAVAIGAKMYLESPQARQPAEITIPAAIDSDLQRQHLQSDSVIRTIRNLTPVNSAPGDAGDQDSEPEGIDEEINRSTVGPVRWV
jgi:hypothetical protein